MMRRGCKGLTSVESILLGIDVSKKGWMKINKNKIIPSNVIDKCIKAVLESPHTNQKAKKCCKAFWRELEAKDYYNMC